MNTDITVVQGPSKYDLLVALGDRHLGRFVKLTLRKNEKHYQVEVMVDGLAVDNNSSDAWIVSFSRGKVFPIGDGSHTGLTGFYSTHTRGGQLALCK
ncbi:hypothetical protein IT087_01870 [Candidatus Uhrbacteria bacterium]|nr:hypothetical protein [Candidatus Uhrbacteria bacterium]